MAYAIYAIGCMLLGAGWGLLFISIIFRNLLPIVCVMFALSLVGLYVGWKNGYIDD